MASGKKNYFRHSAFARRDPGIAQLVREHGKEYYFYFFCLTEMMTEQYLTSDSPPTGEFVLSAWEVRTQLMVTGRGLVRHLLTIQSVMGGQWLVDGSVVKIKYDKILKFIGSYSFLKSEISPNKRKEKERKEKEIKEKEIKGVTQGVLNDKRLSSASEETFWNTYADCFKNRYGELPVRNAKVNSQLHNLRRRVPEKDIPGLIEFYLKSNNRFYLQKLHPIGLLLVDAEKVYVEFKKGLHLTDGELKSFVAKTERQEQYNRIIGESM